MSGKLWSHEGRMSKRNHAHINAVKRHDERLAQLSHVINHPKFEAALNSMPAVGRQAIREYLKDGATFVTVADIMNVNPSDVCRYFKDYMGRIAKRLGVQDE